MSERFLVSFDIWCTLKKKVWTPYWDTWRCTMFALFDRWSTIIQLYNLCILRFCRQDFVVTVCCRACKMSNPCLRVAFMSPQLQYVLNRHQSISQTIAIQLSKLHSLDVKLIFLPYFTICMFYSYRQGVIVSMRPLNPEFFCFVLFAFSTWVSILNIV